MNLTNEMATKFIGGNIKILNKNKDYLYRGPIKAAIVENDEFKVEFEWLAKSEGGLSTPRHWVKDDYPCYRINLKTCNVSDTLEGYLCLSSTIADKHEIVMLYPPNSNKLNPEKVEGL